MKENNAESIAETDAQLDYHETQALSFKLQRNNRTPVSKLSPDVLLEIFLTVRDFDEDQNLSKTVLRITHVCNYWRNVAIYAPILWTRPQTHHCQLEWTEIALQRAKLAPLDLLLDFNHSSPATNKLVLADTLRISRLIIKGMPHKLHSLTTLIPESVPQLKDLQISCQIRKEDVWRFGDEDFDHTDTHKLVLPPTAFQDAAQLCRLTLQYVDFNFDSPWFSNLSSLSLKRVSTNSLPSWAQLTSALRRMPLLEELKLERVFPAGTVSSHDLKPVDLPNLRVVGLYTKTYSQLHGFLSLVTFPRPKKLSLRWAYGHDTEGSQAGTIFRTAAKLVNAQKYRNNFAAFEVLTDFDDHEFRCSAHSPEGYLIEIVYPSTGTEWRDIQAIAEFIEILHLTRITHLSLDSEWDYDSPSWDSQCAWLHKLPLLQKVTTSYGAVFTFFEMIGRPDSFASTGTVRLKELKSVTWRCVDLAKYNWWVKETVVDTLEYRQKGGIPLQELALQDVMGLTSDLLKILTERVPKIIAEPPLQ